MAVAASVLVNLEANIAKFEAPIKQATKSLDAMRKTLGLIVPTSITMLGHEIFNAARYIDSFARSVSSSLNELQRMTEIAGMSVTEFQKWKYAAKMGDIQAESLAIAFKFLSQNMVEADKAFEAMNVNIKDATTGALRPLSDVMKDVMDRFASYEDGAGKSAMATRLFGRTGNELIPFLNKGRMGFEELAAEAKRLGIILDPEVVAAGSALEDQLKKIDAQVEASKAKLIPYVAVWGMLKQSIYEILSIPVEVLSGKLGDTFKDAYNQTDLFTKQIYEALDALDKLREGPSESRFLRKGYKVPVPAVAGKTGVEKDAYLELQKQLLEGQEEFAREQKEAWDAVAKYYEEIAAEELKIREYVWRQEIEGEDQLANDIIEAINSVYQVTLDMDMERVKNHEAALERIREGEEEAAREATEAWDYYYKYEIDKYNEEMAEREKQLAPLKDIATDLGNTWSRVFASMMDGTESFTETVKDAFKSLADSVIQQIIRMITEWLIFQAVTSMGGLFTGGLTGGGLGGGAMAAFNFGPSYMGAKGGIFTKPTRAIIGEAGPEAVIPLKDTKNITGGGNTYVYIQAIDTQSFDDAIRRNPGSILNVIRKNDRESVYASRR